MAEVTPSALSREHYLQEAPMRAILARGETIIHHEPKHLGGKTRYIRSHRQMPTKADFVAGDTKAQAAAAREIEVQVAALLHQHMLITGLSMSDVLQQAGLQQAPSTEESTDEGGRVTTPPASTHGPTTGSPPPTTPPPPPPKP